jgi:hypothetical protein
MRWAVQWEYADTPKKKRGWRLIYNSQHDDRADAVAVLKRRREAEPALPGRGRIYRLVRLTTKSEKLRAKIVEELRTIAEEHALYADAGVDAAWVHSSETLSAVADRIERGEVG